MTAPDDRQTRLDCHIDDLEQYSRRNCLIFTGIKEAGEDETENTEEVILDICRNKLQIELHRFILDSTHRLGRKRIPKPDWEIPKPGPIIAKFITYHDRDSVYKYKRKLKESGLTIMENLTNRRVDLLNEVREAVGVKNTWTFDGCVYAIYEGKKHNKIERKPRKNPIRLSILNANCIFFLY